jgi:hypothetical protein
LYVYDGEKEKGRRKDEREKTGREEELILY